MAYVDRNYFEDSRILRLRACLGRGAELLPLRLFLRFPQAGGIQPDGDGGIGGLVG